MIGAKKALRLPKPSQPNSRRLARHVTDAQQQADYYRRLLGDTRDLYRSSARLIEREHPELAPADHDLVARMNDLHQGLVLRVYLDICRADQVWTDAELRLAGTLSEHLWGERLTGRALNQTIAEAQQRVADIPWETLVGPFLRYAPIRDRSVALETLVVRQANHVARVDGTLARSEQAGIQRISKELNRLFLDRVQSPEQARPVEPASSIETATAGPAASHPKPADDEEDAPAARPLEEVLAELDSLIGLEGVKQEVRSLANYLTLQKRRADSGLPTAEISLHLVFTGAPGTGKTTVARLFGEVLQALGVLPEGKMIETERSGLVAGYAGQTAGKANEKIDEALGGVLFVDEAYGLVAAEGEDPFGAEAMQTLLKRAEDDRHRLAIILAGYPDEMRQLLQTNPGLSSRFARTIHFEDYGPLELCRIFGRLLDEHHYRLSREGRLRVIGALHALHAARDRHFGNGRAVRNLFEQAILRMANRLASEPTLTDEQLVTLEAADIPGDGEPAEVRIACPSCNHASKAPAAYLASRVKCPQCGESFVAEWGELE